MPETNAQRFLTLYEQELLASIKRKPDNYGIRPGESMEDYARTTADKMVTSIIRGNAVNVSDTMRRVARKLGVGTKQQDIYTFIRS